MRLLILTQDFYLPEVRTDLRTGLIQQSASYVRSGALFTRDTYYLLETLRKNRQRLITQKRFNPQAALEEAGLTTVDLKECVAGVRTMAESIDPLASLRDLMRFMTRRKRQELRGRPLLAEDLYEMLDQLILLAGDLGLNCGAPTLLQWQDPKYFPENTSGNQWRRKRYGDDVLRHPFNLLEFLANEFGVNPRPRAVILTEGAEYKALKILYEELGTPASQLGIEFRSLGGHGNFSVANWQCFVEYMHEKQVLVYFVLDNEGRAASEARRLLTAKRKFKSQGLRKVIPAKDRIMVWESSFEEANFTDKQISAALARQGVQVTYQKVSAVRRRQRDKALINALCDDLEVNLDKTQLACDLVTSLVVSIRRHRRRASTPLEEFVDRSAKLIMLNHQPAGQTSVSRNRATGLLG